MLKKIMNLHEEITHSRLRSVCENYSASVYPKFRLADVLPIEGSGISNEDYRFAMQSHFDFLVADREHQALFAVEFDGFSHRDEAQIKRDAIKNRLCDKFELPLLRINSNYLLKNTATWIFLAGLLKSGFWQRAFMKPKKEEKSPMMNLSILFS